MKAIPSVISLLLLTASLASAIDTIIVTTSNDEDDGPNSLNDLSDISLREAINYSTRNAQVMLFAGNAGEKFVLTEGPLIVDQSVTLIGFESQFAKFLIQGDGQSRLFEVSNDAALSLERIQLTGGSATGNSPDDRGGAIYMEEGELQINFCDFFDNHAGVGGAICGQSGDTGSRFVLRECTLTNNTADLGGAIAGFVDESFSRSFLLDTTFSQNSARLGGALYLFADREESILNISNSTFSNNTASEDGGAFYNESLNRADVFINIDNSTFAKNTAANKGGAIASDTTDRSDVEITIEHVTLSQNAAASGGGIANTADDDGEVTVTFQNAIIAGNDADFSKDYLEEGDDSTDLTIDTTGTNLFSDFAGSPLEDSHTSDSSLVEVDDSPSSSSPLALSSLSSYGGLTQTLHPSANSAAIRSSDHHPHRPTRFRDYRPRNGRSSAGGSRLHCRQFGR